MKNQNKPLAFTMGDPSGIGPEIIVKTIFRENLSFKNIIVGDILIIEETIKALKYNIKIKKIRNVDEAIHKKNIINVLQVGEIKKIPKLGKIIKNNGKLSYDYIIKAFELIKSNKISAIVTAPINKEALCLDKIKYPGHTEILASCNNSKNVSMMMMNDQFKTVLVTTHLSLKNAIKNITINNLLLTIENTIEWFGKINIKKPVIAVAALNPHGGEGGQFGNEEEKIILPAIMEAKEKGMNIIGPIPADTVFMKAREGAYDVVISLYHDQALIPIKYLGLEKGINVTLGLDFIRTSPDHGTAYDIAGKGIANHKSFYNASLYANELKKLWG